MIISTIITLAEHSPCDTTIVAKFSKHSEIKCLSGGIFNQFSVVDFASTLNSSLAKVRTFLF